MNTNKNAIPIKSLVLIFILWGLTVFHLSAKESLAGEPPGEKPIKVSVDITIIKVFDINTVDGSYKIDGYLVTKWIDKEKKCSSNAKVCEPGIYMNSDAKKLIEEGLWVPTLEFINVQGKRETSNIRIEIENNDTIRYHERFVATFVANMHLKLFPFDTQEFEILFESWGYDMTNFVFNSIRLNPGLKKCKRDSIINTVLPQWEVLCIKETIIPQVYTHIDTTGGKSNKWSRGQIEISAKRESGYYKWQVLLPLLIIIIASFVMFWIKDFSAQLGVGFTLMLTVVAFNFFSTSMLPKLSYNTFIESIIIVGYFFIFFGIIAVIAEKNLNEKRKRKKKKDSKLLKFFRWAFPIGFIITMLAVLMYYFC